MLAGSSPHTGGYYNQPFVRIHISGSKLICTRLDGHVLCISSSRPTCVYQQSCKTIPSATCQHRNCLVRRQWCWRCLSTAVIKKQIIRSMAQKEVRATNLCKLHTRVLSDVLFPSSRLVNFASSYERSNSWKSDTTKAHTQTALSCGSSSSLDSYRIFQPRKNMLDDFFQSIINEWRGVATDWWMLHCMGPESQLKSGFACASLLCSNSYACCLFVSVQRLLAFARSFNTFSCMLHRTGKLTN